MVGRAAVGNPLLFLEFLEEEKNGAREPQAINAAPRFSLLREHAQLIVDYYGEKLGICRLRKYIGSYIHGLYGAAEFRRRAVGAVALNELLGLLDTYEASL
jgi:tRNA-dihydrouridine synthase